MRDTDSSVKRQRNKPLRQFEKNIFETNFFNSLGIVIRTFTESNLDYAMVKLIPSVRYKDFDFQTGYTDMNPTNPVIKAIISDDVKLKIQKDKIVLVTFVDTDFRESLVAIANGKKLDDNFITDNLIKNSLDYGIITNVIL